MKHSTSTRPAAIVARLFFFTFLGSIATLYVGRLDINPIVASAIVSISLGLFAVAIDDHHHLAWGAFCGSFAGMTSTHFVTWGSAGPALAGDFLARASLLSFVTAALYVAVELLTMRYPRALFHGYGGRLGSIAFGAVLLFLGVGRLVDHGFQAPLVYARPFAFDVAPLKLLAVPSALLGALVYAEIKSTVAGSNINYKVVTAATTGIIGGILLVKIPVHGYFMAQAWYAGAFVGMTSFFEPMPRRDFALAGSLSGLLLALTDGICVGVGGKLGLLAFLAVVMMRAARVLARGAARRRGALRVEEMIDSL